MTVRERRLALVVGGAVGLAAVWWIGKSIYQRSIVAHRLTIRAVQDDIDKLEAEKRRLKTSREDWKKLVSRTLDYAPDRAHMRFREDISALLERHGFTKNQLTVRSLAQRRNKDGTVELPVQVTTKGKLKELVALLVDMSRREYLLRVENLSINAEQARAATASTGARRGRNVPAAQPAGDPDGPALSIAFTAVTVTVPKLAGISAEPMKEIIEAPQGRLPRPVEEYERIASINVFSDYKAPPQPVDTPAVADATPAPAQADATPPPPPPPPPNPRPDAEHLVLVGSVSRHGEARALVRDERKPAESAEPHALNGRLDDGVLVLVHPRGIVVHATEGPDAGKQFFYRVGAKFTERIPVENVQHQDVLRDLQIAMGRSG